MTDGRNLSKEFPIFSRRLTRISSDTFGVLIVVKGLVRQKVSAGEPLMDAHSSVFTSRLLCCPCLVSLMKTGPEVKGSVAFCSFPDEREVTGAVNRS